MRGRIDALGDDVERLGAVTGRIASFEEDPELQALASEAAATLGTPVALVSLVLRRAQIYRASVGLHEDLAKLGGIDRDASFCQLVVRDNAPVAVEHASVRPDAPQDMVARYGAEAYLGVPVYANDAVLGALCVVDGKPRAFDDVDRDKLARIAERVSARLEQLGGRGRERPEIPSLDDRALRPAFEEARNLLVPLRLSAALARVAAREVLPLEKLATMPADEVHRLRDVVGAAPRALADLRESVDDVSALSERLDRLLVALEHAAVDGLADATLGEALGHARGVALHDVRLVGGLRVEGDEAAPLGVPLSLGVRALSATLSTLARRARANGELGELRVALGRGARGANVRVSNGALTDATLGAVAQELQEALRSEPSVWCVAEKGALELRLRGV